MAANEISFVDFKLVTNIAAVYLFVTQIGVTLLAYVTLARIAANIFMLVIIRGMYPTSGWGTFHFMVLNTLDVRVRMVGTCMFHYKNYL